MMTAIRMDLVEASPQLMKCLIKTACYLSAMVLSLLIISYRFSAFLIYWSRNTCKSESYMSISQVYLHVAKLSLLYFISSYGGADPVPREADDYYSESSVPLDTDGGFSQMHPFHVYIVLPVHALTEADAAELSPS
jgi:hypothetical protein